nr:hypothetical protein BSM_22410 [uncultured archaeon]
MYIVVFVLQPKFNKHNFLKRITALVVIISNIGYPNFFHITFRAYLKIPKGNLSEGDNRSLIRSVKRRGFLDQSKAVSLSMHSLLRWKSR